MSQGKLLTVIKGKIFDVAVDLRRSSETFGNWISVFLTAENHHQLWIPVGFAHGFLVLSEKAVFSYKVDSYYHPPSERSLSWNDKEIKIN